VPPSAPIGPTSSFCQYKGFCSGALEVMRGGMGVKKIKKPVSLVDQHCGGSFERSEDRGSGGRPPGICGFCCTVA
jgi:hypothetical protein